MSASAGPFEVLFAVMPVLLMTKRTPDLERLSHCALVRLAAACIVSGRRVTLDMLSPEQRENILAGVWQIPTFDAHLRPTGGRAFDPPRPEDRPS